MKYVIWGCGVYGKWVTDILSKEWEIVAFVESNAALQGLTYHKIPIISYDEYLLTFTKYPLIVSPIYHEDEIVEQLKAKGILWAFPLSKDMASIESFFVQLPTAYALRSYAGISNIAIYGVSVLGFVLYEWFERNGFKVGIIIPHNTDFLLKKYVSETLKLNVIPEGNIKEPNQRILLAAEVETYDKDSMDGTTCDKYYDLQLHEELFYNPGLEKFKNIHEGKRCFIVGTGPSLRIEDLDTLYINQEICISVNEIFRAFDQTKWRPHYYSIVDPDTRIWKDDIIKMDAQAKFVGDLIHYFDDKHYDGIYKWHLIRKEKDDPLPRFSSDFSRGVHAGRTVVYEGGLQLAAYMGFKEIYLLGTDCTLGSDGKTPHFIEDDSVDPGRLNLREIMLAYQAAKLYADTHGIKIYNATRGGNLEVFPRVDFDSLFER